MDFEMAEINSSEPNLQRFRAKCALSYPTRYFSPLEDEADLVGNSLDHHSTDSYLSSSPNSSSKDKVLVESVDSMDDEPLFLEPNRDLSDCETSLSTRRSCRESIHNLSGVLNNIDQLKGSKFSCAKQMNQLKGFAFDCLLEYLGSKFSPISDSGFRTYTKLPSSMTKEILIADIIDEFEEWTQFVGLIPNELIEWDMSHSLGICMDFEIEDYGCGTEVARHIL
ncbi:hypothetical protein CQW23_15708 [Capsicum baccatum]|uniref:DUF4378 domain-containing protein n=1 Tax=Capsicum baccatum TaxID=33114 RepID=A0A2G2WN12_CAPBA|nr:hypothetical protein CQW23_15708 [Capsicum baccatum]